MYNKTYNKQCDPVKLHKELHNLEVEPYPENNYSFYGVTISGNDTVIHFKDNVDSAIVLITDNAVNDHINSSLTINDLSTITDWEEYGELFRDYKYCRKQIMTIAYVTGFSNLNQEDKEVAASWFAVGDSDRDSVFTMEEQIAHGKIFHTKSAACRSNRATDVKLLLYNRLQKADAYTVVSDCWNLVTEYIEYGVEGTLEGDTEGLFDYMEARTGTSFQNTGLAAKSFTPKPGTTLQEIVTAVMSILNNGY